MKPPDQVGYQVASLRSELDVLIPHSPGGVDTNEAIHSPKSTTAFSPSTDPCDCSFDLERCLTPVIQSWLSWMRFDAGPMDSPSSFSSFSPAARTPTGPRSVSSLSDSTSTPDCSPQLVVELDFYLLDWSTTVLHILASGRSLSLSLNATSRMIHPDRVLFYYFSYSSSLGLFLFSILTNSMTSSLWTKEIRNNTFEVW